VEDVLIKVGELIYPMDFVVIEIEKVSNAANQVPVILGRPFLTTSNALINCMNGMMRVSSGNMTLELNIFKMQRQPSSFDDIEFPIINGVNDFVFDNGFHDIFATEYESFLVDDEPEYDMSKFDDLYSTADCLLTTVSEFAPESISPLAFKLKPLPNSLKYTFLGPDE